MPLDISLGNIQVSYTSLKLDLKNTLDKETDVYVLYVCEDTAQTFENLELCTNHF